MPRYRVRPQNDDATIDLADLEAEDWTTALGDVLAQLGVGADAVPTVVCEISPDGGVDVRGEGMGSPVRLVPIDEEELPSIDITQDVLAARAVAQDLPTDPAPAGVTDEGQALAAARLQRLDALLGDIDPTGDHAAAEVLRAVLQIVPAESGAVLVHDRRVGVLRFAAAQGPRSAGLFGVEIPADAGIAGFVHRTGQALRVRETALHAAHYDAVDQTTGYRTRAILAVPVSGGPGAPPAAVLELLNPFGGGGFADWHQHAALRAAQRLGR